jgi:hypothetical protein
MIDQSRRRQYLSALLVALCALEPPGAVYRREPEHEREIRRRIEILRAFYGVDIWSEDLDRLLRSGP